MNKCMSDTVASIDLKQPPTTECSRTSEGPLLRAHPKPRTTPRYAVREVNFIQQYLANAVLMWMVVIITLSGVALAALQLMASFQLASAKDILSAISSR